MTIKASGSLEASRRLDNGTREVLPMSFTAAEVEYLTTGRLLGRLATVGRDGSPHIAPVGWTLNTVLGTIDVGGYSLERTKKFRDVARNGRGAIVIDDVLPPWQPRGIEVRGRAEAITDPTPLIRLHPMRIVSWGLDNAKGRSARDV